MAPSLEKIVRKLTPYCVENDITQLEIFGSVARKESDIHSDVDLLATFGRNPGLTFFGMEEEMSAILGAKIHLLTRDAVENSSNSYRRNSILGDARVIYQAKSSHRSQRKLKS